MLQTTRTLGLILTRRSQTQVSHFNRGLLRGMLFAQRRALWRTSGAPRAGNIQPNNPSNKFKYDDNRVVPYNDDQFGGLDPVLVVASLIYGVLAYNLIKFQVSETQDK